MFCPTHGRSWAFTIAALVLIACLIQAAVSFTPAETAPAPKAGCDKEAGMTPTKKAEAMGIKFEKLKPGYLKLVQPVGEIALHVRIRQQDEGSAGPKHDHEGRLCGRSWNVSLASILSVGSPISSSSRL